MNHLNEVIETKNFWLNYTSVDVQPLNERSQIISPGSRNAKYHALFGINGNQRTLLHKEKSQSASEIKMLSCHQDLTQAWVDKLGTIAVNNNDEIEEAFMHFKVGTSRYDIIIWMENEFEVNFIDFLN
ncbi:hypothetical protein A1QO_04120 [Vibrio genomosp. F10 str. ZF-129]|uniref:Uncharacterized protein n=1 Tax=Vibrio genomosp. F10 str. ZF-129 TaxID=1187848 RepID=A0A1E5BIQ2_9VIBR|nr:hypothetical protein [Vibrio genomosp. F10]OEE37298.1 hypothetical protein A1QO_04120 [Vibrio genomosp. F10 str. ZF-129]